MRISFEKLGWIGVAVFACGCVPTELGDRMGEAGVDAPASWQATRAAAKGVDRDWLQRIGGRELTSLVGEALAANPNLKAAAANVERAAAEARIAGAGRQPALGGEGTARRSEQKFVGFPFGGGGGVPGSLTNNFGVALNAAWELDVWGRMRAGQRAAMADARAEAAEYEAARVSLAAQMAKAWLALAEANEQVVLAEEALESRRILAEAVRQRFERAITEDGGSAAQVRLTESEVASGEAFLAQRRQERERAIRQLELLMGRYPSGKLIAAAKMPSMPGPAPAGLPSELLLRRPDVLAAERRLAAEGGRKRKAQLARFPSITLTGSLGTTTGSLDDILSSDFGVWSLGGSLTQPIFQGGRIAGEIDKATAVESRAAADLQRTVLGAFGEVEQALAAEVFLRERESATARAAKLAVEAAQRADEEFSAGTGDVLTLIETRQQQIVTASQLAAIRRLRLDQRIDLHLALGGDFKL
jgi:NodT family efflux transporter outer membrane factor (OMF) lipoprotein